MDGQIVDLVSSLTIQETRFRQKMDEVNEYMNARELPLKLRMEIREFYHNTRQSRESKLNSEHQILSDLSSKLRSKIALSINDQFLRKFPFFTGSDPNFLMELALNMRMIHFAPLEDVIIEGEIGHEMFFIFRGAVEVRKDDTRIGILGENQYFGEMAILNPDCRRTATVRTLCFCELRMLSRTRFLEALALFPSMQVKMAQIAKGRAFPLAAIKAKANAAVAVAPAETAGAIETPTKRGSVNRSPSVTKRGIHSIDGVSAVTTAAGTAGASDEASDLLPTLPLTAATRRKSFVRGMSQLELVQQYNGDSFQPVRATTSARISSAVHRSSGSASSISAAGAGRSGSLSGGNGGTGVTPAMSMAISEIASLLDESVRQQHALMHQMNSLKARLDRHISLANREKKAKTDQLPRHASLGS
jgi:CRP-like cAMP-binding protein